MSYRGPLRFHRAYIGPSEQDDWIIGPIIHRPYEKWSVMHVLRVIEVFFFSVFFFGGDQPRTF